MYKLSRKWLSKLASYAFSKTPLRVIFLRLLLEKLTFIPYPTRLLREAVPRPYYGYPIYHSLKLASSLGYKKVSIMEFGVAGGRGLINAEYHVREIQKILDIEVEIYGFDLIEGLPRPVDYRDLPYQWKEGFYKMDVEKLKSKLKFSKLVLGDIKESIKNFSCSPIACVLMDVDYYSSTVDALEIFKMPHLPRVFCYFDDVVGNETCLYNEYTGELLAIKEFNQNNKMKIVKYGGENTSYNDNIFIMHDFDHPQYNSYVNVEDGNSCNLD